MTGGFPLSTNHIKLKFMEVNLWNFSIVRLLLCRLSLWASAVRCAFGAASTFWKVTARITLPAMLMCHKVTHKNLIDSSPLFRYYLTHTPCNFFVKPIDSDTSEEI